MQQKICTGSDYADDAEAHTDNGGALTVWIRTELATARLSFDSSQNSNGLFLSTASICLLSPKRSIRFGRRVKCQL
jgi:hypothetical protein